MAKDDISVLSAAFKANKLRLIVGAGPSIQSGLPGWDELNLRLVKNYLLQEHRQPAATIDELATKLYVSLGRDAVADLVFVNSKKEVFNKLLADSLYENRTFDLPLHSIHYQIAVMRDKADIYTTNFDPLLELAIAATRGEDTESEDRLWRNYREPGGAGFERDPAHGKPIVHLHGWVDPNGDLGEPVILRESQYQELAQQTDAKLNAKLRDVLDHEGATLILGMSLGDPNLRRLFYFLSKTSLAEANIWAVFKMQDPLLDDYVKGHWERLGVKLMFAKEHDEIPGLLRDVQYGMCDDRCPPNWIEKALVRLESHVKTGIVLTEPFQNMAYSALQLLSDRVRRFFAVPPEEIVGLSVFLPLKLDGAAQASLHEVCTSRHQRTEAEARQQGRIRKLSIGKNIEQGLPGIAYTSGKHLEILDDERAIYRNFTGEMKHLWRSERRDWRSILAMPFMDDPTGLPIAVVAITSNCPEPFWTRFGERRDRYQIELFAMMRETTNFILGGFEEEPNHTSQSEISAAG
jgi:hypothetical protein